MNKMHFQLAGLFLNVSCQTCKSLLEHSVLLCVVLFFLGLVLTTQFTFGCILPCS